MRNNGVDRGILPTRKQGPSLPLFHDRASRPKYTDNGDLTALAVLAPRHSPPSDDYDASAPSKRPGFRWFWYFLKVVGIPAGIIWCIASELGIDLAAVLK